MEGVAVCFMIFLDFKNCEFAQSVMGGPHLHLI